MKNNTFQTKIGVSMEYDFKESSTIYILGGINWIWAKFMGHMG